MLSKQLKTLRESKHKSQQEVCSALNIEQSTLANYENGKRIPKIEILIKIAEYYQCSVDFLLGIEKSNGTNYANYQMDVPEFALDFKMKVRELIEEEGISEEEFAQRAGFLREEKDDYLYGNRIPSIEDLIKIAGALRVSSDYLLDISQRKRISPEDELFLQTISPRERNLLDTFRQLNDDNKDIIVGESKKCLKEQRYESVAAEEPQRRAK